MSILVLSLLSQQLNKENIMKSLFTEIIFRMKRTSCSTPVFVMQTPDTEDKFIT